MGTSFEVMTLPPVIFRTPGPELTLESVDPVLRQFVTWYDGLPNKHMVILEMSEVLIITTPGIGLLLEIRKLVNGAGGRLVVTAPSALVQDVIHRTQLDRLLEIAQTITEAEELLAK